MKRLLISIIGVMAAAAFAQESPAPARRSPEQIFEFLDKDKNGTLSEAEFGALKDKIPTLRARPDAVSVKFKELDKDHNGSLTIEEFRPMMTQGSRCPGATPAPAAPGTPAPAGTPSTPPTTRRSSDGFPGSEGTHRHATAGGRKSSTRRGGCTGSTCPPAQGECSSRRTLTYRYAGRDFRLTDVKGNVVKEIIS